MDVLLDLLDGGDPLVGEVAAVPVVRPQEGPDRETHHDQQGEQRRRVGQPAHPFGVRQPEPPQGGGQHGGGEDDGGADEQEGVQRVGQVLQVGARVAVPRDQPVGHARGEPGQQRQRLPPPGDQQQADEAGDRPVDGVGKLGHAGRIHFVAGREQTLAALAGMTLV